MDMVELTFQYTQDEYVKAERQYLVASKTVTKKYAVFILLCFIFAILYLFLSSFSVFSMIILGVVLLSIVVVCIVYFYIPIYNFKRTSKYHEEYNLIFSKDCIKFKTPTIHSELKWNVYSELWESNDFYFMIQGPQIYSVIPKRAIKSAALKQAFEEIVLSNLQCKKRIL